MLGHSLLGWRLADLRSVLLYLRDRAELDRGKFVLWGDSLAPVNSPESDLAVPFDAGAFPELSEPLGGLLALLAGVVEHDVCAVVARGAWFGFASLLETPFCYTPFDAVVPRMLELCEIDDLAAAQLPRPLLLDGLVDGLNRTVDQQRIDLAFRRTRQVYQTAGVSANLGLSGGRRTNRELARWILERGLNRPPNLPSGP